MVRNCVIEIISVLTVYPQHVSGSHILDQNTPNFFGMHIFHARFLRHIQSTRWALDMSGTYTTDLTYSQGRTTVTGLLQTHFFGTDT